MRTDSQNKLSETSSVNIASSEPKDVVKVPRKSLHPLQVAAGDKENLVGAGRMIPNSVEKDSKAVGLSLNRLSSAPSPPKKEKKKLNKIPEKPIVKVEDLTSEEEPSESYWKLLAETRRKALELALSENEELHETVGKLEKELEKYKELVNEAQDIIDTLNEVIAEDNRDDSGVGEDVIQLNQGE